MKEPYFVETLRQEQKLLYPHGYPIQPRGCGKTLLYFSHFLRWNAYETFIPIYANDGHGYSLEQAHRDIDEYVRQIMELY